MDVGNIEFLVLQYGRRRVHRLPTKREAHNERRVNWCSKRGACAARFDKRLIGLQKADGSWRAQGAMWAAGAWSRYEAEAVPTGRAATRVITDGF